MSFKHRLFHLLHRDAADSALDDEVRFHIECQTRANIEAGMTPEDARRAAMLEFGPVEGLKERCRAARGVDWLDHCVRDVRYALRNFRKRPAFALTAVAVTALGIGSAAAVFSVVDKVLFRDLPYRQPEQIASVGISFPIFEYDFLTSTSYRELKREHPPFDSLTSWSGVVPCDLTESNPVRLSCARVESTFLPFFGIEPLLGRNFTAAEDLPGVPRMALVTHSFWKSRFNGNPGAVGSTLSLDSTQFTVIGVLPETFELPSLDKADVVFPQALPPNDTARSTRPIRVFARLKPGVTAAQAVPMLQPFYDYVFRTEAPPQYRNEARLRARHFFLAVQMALSLVLLTSSALLLQSLSNQRDLHLGLSTDRAVTAEITLGTRYRTPAERQAFFDTIDARLRAMPGVRSVAHSDSLPPGGISRNQPYFVLQAEGRPDTPRGTGGIVVWRAVSSSYFEALRIPILRGRAFDAADTRPEVRSVILSESLAKRLFPGQDPLGRHFKRFFETDWCTVVGIARDVRNGGLADESSLEFYLPRRLAPETNFRTANFVVRGDAPAAVMESWIRSETASLDRTLPVSPRTLDDWIGELAARPRFQALLLSLFAALGLLLAATGLYGLMSFLVTQRTSEFGVRLALGASPSNLTRMLLGQAVRFALPGLLAGLLAAAAAVRALRTMLFHVSPFEPRAFLIAATVLVVSVLIAAFLPARQAARLDPIAILRQD